MAQRYGLHGLGEAKAYLADPLLRQRLNQVIDVIHHQLQHPDLTLFEATGLASATTLLNHLGRRCAWTMTQD
jgi:uncharacterized protein (DUF1810 family)